MDAHESQRNHKRQKMNDESAPESNGSKSNHNESDDHRSPESIDQRPATPERPMKITDLYDDCMMNIFEHLDLRNLFNVAVANEWLRSAVCDVYRRRCGMKKVCMNIHDYFYGLTCGPYENGDEIKVHGFRKCLQYLRCLGSSISDLGVWYTGWTNKQCQHIDEYVNKYCADSLIYIKWVGKPNMSIKHFEKPFVNVLQVEIFGGDLGNQLPSFTYWFPNIRTFVLSSVRMDERYIETPFQHLRDLRIIGIQEDNSRRFNDEDVAGLLGMCHQLQCLHICVYDSQRMAFFAEPFDVQRLVQEHPALVELDLSGYKVTPEHVIALIQQLNSLKTFRFRVKANESHEYDDFVNQVVRCIGGRPWQQTMFVDDWRHQIITLQR